MVNADHEGHACSGEAYPSIRPCGSLVTDFLKDLANAGLESSAVDYV